MTSEELGIACISRLRIGEREGWRGRGGDCRRVGEGWVIGGVEGKREGGGDSTVSNRNRSIIVARHT